jgi:hypothetical protein
LEEKQSFVVGGVQLDVHPESDTLAHKRSLNAGQLFIVIALIIETKYLAEYGDLGPGSR